MYNTDLPTRAELPSTAKLLRSTAIAALIAVGLLVTTVLPAEYGIDPTGVGSVLGLTKMGEIKAALAAEAKAEKAPPAGTAQPPAAVQSPAIAETSAVASPAKPLANEAGSKRENTMTFKLKSGEAAEIKLAMSKHSKVRYEWSTSGGSVNYDTHGDQGSAIKYHGYGKGQDKTGDTGTLQAAFDGKHGWYWRNRSGAEVTITLKTSGDYAQIERVL